MSAERLLIDTTFVQALLNRADQYHQRARAVASRISSADEHFVRAGLRTLLREEE